MLAAPSAVNDSATTFLDISVTIEVLANDTDPEGNTLTVTSFTDPANGSVAPDAADANKLVYTPDAGFLGKDTFNYTITDTEGLKSTAKVTVNVFTDPHAEDDAATTLVDTPVTINVRSNDLDAEGKALTVTGFTDPPNGTVAPDAANANNLVYTPDAGFTGSDSFDYTITDKEGNTDTGTVNVTVVATDPDAVNDTATTLVDTPVTIDVTANDIDVEGKALTVTANTTPANGTVTPDAKDANMLVYTPNAGFTGSDKFDYTITDKEGNTDTATVKITILASDPDAVNDKAVTLAGTSVTIDVLANDLDAEGKALTVTGFTDPPNGTVVADVTDPNKLVYTPDPGFSGSDSFDYTITDKEGGTDTATVKITVAATDPDAVNDTAVTLVDTPVTIDVTANDIDVEGKALNVTATTTPANGTVAPDATDPNKLVYTPNAGFTGSDKFDYTITDKEGGTDTATVKITIAATDPDAVDDKAVTAVDTPVTVDVTANDIDIEGKALTVTANTTPANGTVAPDATDPNLLVYTPNAGFSGSDKFDYTITDKEGNTDTATVKITILASDPDAVDDKASTFVDTPVTIDVTANDLDVEGKALTVSAFTDPPSGSVAPDAVDPNKLVYTPDAGFTGKDTFNYTITDKEGNTDTATVTVTVDPDPNAVNDKATTVVNTPVTIDVTANDEDAEGKNLTVSAFTDPPNGSVAADAVDPDKLVYTPDTGFTGIDAFDYTITDKEGNTDTATVTVTVIASDPDAVDDTDATVVNTPVTIDVTANDIDAEGKALTVTSFTDPPNGSVAPSAKDANKLVYTPDTDFVGTDQFLYTITDKDGNTDTATVTVTVAASDPDAVDDTATTPAGSPVTIDVTANDSDLQGKAVTVTAFSDPPNGSVAADATDPNKLVYTPDAGFSGSDTFTYTISDPQGNTDTATVTVSVTATGQDPDAVNDFASTTTGAPVTVTVLANDTDVEGLALTVTSFTDPPNGSVVRSASDSNKLVYTSDAGFAGTDSFSYTITDAEGNTDTATVTVSVSAPPPPPPPGPGAIIDADVVPRDGTEDSFIRNLYEDLLDRAPDAAGLQSWQAILGQNGDDQGARREIINGFLSSREYLENLVEAMYREFLNRAPDSGGLDFWTDQLEGGATEEEVIAGFILSPEYRLTHGTNALFVTGLYNDLLGRAPDSAGLTFWVGKLDSGESSREEVLAGFLDSDEFNLLRVSDAAGRATILEAWNQDYLDGQLQAGLVDEFFEQLEAGVAWHDVQIDILALPSYFNAALQP